MKSSTVVLALASAASANVIVARDVATVLADIATINTDTTNLATALNAFSSINDAAGLIAAESGLEAAIKKGTADAQATTSVSDSEAESVLSAIRSLIPNIVTSLNAAVAKDPAFTSAGIASVVAGDFTALRADSKEFADALIAAAPEGAKAGGSAASACIDDAFASALATKTANGDCAASVTFAGGASSASATSSAEATPASSASSAEATSESSAVEAPASTSAEAGSTATSVAVAPFPTASTAAPPVATGTGSSYPTYTPAVVSTSGAAMLGASALTAVVGLAAFFL